MHVNKTFHESLRACYIAEMLEAYDLSEQEGLTTRQQHRLTVRVYIWTSLAEDEGKFIANIQREERETTKMRSV